MSEEAFTAGLKRGHTAYILFCVQGPLEEFRIPEILSIIQLFALDVSWPVPPDHTVRTPPAVPAVGLS